MNPVLLKPTSERSSQVIVMGRPLETRQAADYQRSKADLVEIVDGALADLRSPLRRGDLRGRGQPGRDQPARPRHREPGPGRPRRHPGRRGRRHPPGWRLRPSLRHGGHAARGPSPMRPRPSSSTCSGAIPRCSATPWSSSRPAVACPPWACCPSCPDWSSTPRTPCTGCWRPARRAESRAGGRAEQLDVVVLRLPRLSNFTDFDPLLVEGGVAVRFVDHPSAFGDPDLIVLPGTKSTVADLEWVRDERAAARRCEARRRAASPPMILGVCGGFQMLGRDHRGSRRRGVRRAVGARPGLVATGHPVRGREDHPAAAGTGPGGVPGARATRSVTAAPRPVRGGSSGSRWTIRKPGATTTGGERVRSRAGWSSAPPCTACSRRTASGGSSSRCVAAARGKSWRPSGSLVRRGA